MRHISLLRSVFFYPRGVYSTVFTQQQHQQRKCIRSSRTFFYVTFNNFNDFFHGNSLLIKMQTLKTENTLILRVRCVFSFSLSPSILPSFFLQESICGDVIDANFIIIVYSLALLCKCFMATRRYKWNKMCKKEAGSAGP